MSDTRRKILRCACDLYLKKGLDGFSMRELAKSVGVTAPALYRHYLGREEVLLDVVGEAYKLFSRYLHRALEGNTPLGRFLLAGEGYLEFALTHSRFYEVLYASPDAIGVDEFPEDARAQMSAVGNFWQDRIRECIADGILREGDPEDISITMWAHAHGLVTIYLRGMARVGEEEFRVLFRESSHRAISGLAARRYQEALKDVGAAPGWSRSPW